jgi:lipoprotein NlpD
MLLDGGRYRVRTGDTLHAIAFSFSLDFREVARWNDIRPPYTIYPGQILKMTPQPRTAAAPPAQRDAGKPAVERPAADTASGRASPPTSAPKQPSRTGVATGQGKPGAGADPNSWLWPVKGRILRGFSPTDPARDGLDIAGREGQAVLASAAGTVVYSGNGLIGYGELIIVKHSERMLSAYGHNRVRLVAEGAEIRAGQKIAELGRNDRNEEVLHFEIRVNGRPVNPLTYLPDP